ncbi:MAG: hypothetical protein JWO85_526 [Candidatus Eremiobacteraeota bacterium]|nr:hypothetical protein [Candidatus Eremiobacteraeota bacterium]
MTGDFVTCCSCAGRGKYAYGVAACDTQASAHPQSLRDCIPCDGTGRLPQRYPVRG